MVTISDNFINLEQHRVIPSYNSFDQVEVTELTSKENEISNPPVISIQEQSFQPNVDHTYHRSKKSKARKVKKTQLREKMVTSVTCKESTNPNGRNKSSCIAIKNSPRTLIAAKIQYRRVPVETLDREENERRIIELYKYM